MEARRASDHVIMIEHSINKIENGEEKYFNYSIRALWLRAVVLGGVEGLAMTTLLMMGNGTNNAAIKHNTQVTVYTSIIGLLASAICTAVSEYVSVYTQVDIMTFQYKRDVRTGRGTKQGLVPSPMQVAISASLSYVVGGILPILVVGFLRHDHPLHPIMLAVVASCFLFSLGVFGAALGKAPIVRSLIRVTTGGWLVIGVMLGKTELLSSLRI